MAQYTGSKARGHAEAVELEGGWYGGQRRTGEQQHRMVYGSQSTGGQPARSSATGKDTAAIGPYLILRRFLEAGECKNLGRRV